MFFLSILLEMSSGTTEEELDKVYYTAIITYNTLLVSLADRFEKPTKSLLLPAKLSASNQKNFNTICLVDIDYALQTILDMRLSFNYELNTTVSSFTVEDKLRTLLQNGAADYTLRKAYTKKLQEIDDRYPIENNEDKITKKVNQRKRFLEKALTFIFHMQNISACLTKYERFESFASNTSGIARKPIGVTKFKALADFYLAYEQRGTPPKKRVSAFNKNVKEILDYTKAIIGMEAREKLSTLLPPTHTPQGGRYISSKGRKSRKASKRSKETRRNYRK